MIGRDHLDAGSVASPNRETEAMRDGSDAIADWPLLNALVNTAAGATWVCIHHGGGTGIGYSQHAGMVVVADGTELAGPEARARADHRPGHGRRPPCRRGLRAGDRGRPRARGPHPDARRSDLTGGLRRGVSGRGVRQFASVPPGRPPRRGARVVDRLPASRCSDATGEKSTAQDREEATDRADPDRRAQADRAPRKPPRMLPIGIVPQTMKRIVAFMRPCIRSGVIAWRKLTWLML